MKPLVIELGKENWEAIWEVGKGKKNWESIGKQTR